MMKRRQFPRGFTLIEVTVSLAIGGLVLLMAARLSSVLQTPLGRVTELDEANGRMMRVQRWIDAGLSSLDFDNGTVVFDGHPEQVTYRARLLQPTGWFEPVTVQLFLNSGRLIARLGNGRELILLNNVEAVRCEYLAEPGETPKWGDTWSGASSPPLAVRLRIKRIGPGQNRAVEDSLTFRIRVVG